MSVSSIKAGRPILAAIGSMILYLVLFQIYLNSFVNQFSNDFEKQNAAQIASGNVFDITNRVNALLGSTHWTCIVINKGSDELFRRQSGSCESTIISRRSIIKGAGNNAVMINLTLRLPLDLERLLGLFAALQISTLALIIVLSRRLEREKFRSSEHLRQIATQVAHDIRSPLTTLSAIVSRTQGLDEKTRLDVRNAAQRIADIANNLLARNRAEAAQNQNQGAAPAINAQATTHEPTSTELLSSLVESALSQKREQFPAAQLTSSIETFATFVELQPIEFSRVLSNLLNNAIEACTNATPQITVRIKQAPAQLNTSHVHLTIEDNGRGIPPELLPKVLERGGSYGKAHGNGLGLSHAKAATESWFGKLSIASTVGRSTTVTLDLPEAEAPSWFAQTISLTPKTTVVVLDDDPAIHELWEERLKQRLLHFNSSAELLTWYRANLGAQGEHLYLCDYELTGSAQNGLEVIEMLGIQNNAILVTHRADEVALQERCRKKGVKMLPKGLVGIVPIAERSGT